MRNRETKKKSGSSERTPREAFRRRTMAKKNTKSKGNNGGSDYEVVTIDGKEYKRYCSADKLKGNLDMTINSFCNPVKAVDSIRSVLTEDELKEFRNSVFGYLLDIGNMPWVSAQLICMLVGNYVEPLKEADIQRAIQFQIGKKLITMKKQDFALITGFEFAVNTPSLSANKPGEVWRKFFNGKRSIDRSDLRQVFESLSNTRAEVELDKLDAVKLGLVHVLGNYILGNQPTIKIPTAYINLVDNIEEFNRYPWGDVVWADLVEKLPKCAALVGEGKKSRPTFPGYIFALQIWAFETFPELRRARVCIRKPCSYMPRILNWSAPSRTSSHLLNERVFGNPEFEWEAMEATELELKSERLANALKIIGTQKVSAKAVSKRRSCASGEGSRSMKKRKKGGRKSRHVGDEVEESEEGMQSMAAVSEGLLNAVREQGERIDRLENTIKKLCDLQVKQASMIKKLLVNVKKGKGGVIRKFNFVRKKREAKDHDVPSFDLAPEFEGMNDEAQVKEDGDMSTEYVEEHQSGVADDVSVQVDNIPVQVGTKWNDGFDDPISTQVLVTAVDDIVAQLNLKQSIEKGSTDEGLGDGETYVLDEVNNGKMVEDEVEEEEQKNEEKSELGEEIGKRPRRGTKVPDRLTLSGPVNNKKRKTEGRIEGKEIVLSRPMSFNLTGEANSEADQIVVEFMSHGLLKYHKKAEGKKYRARDETIKLRNGKDFWNDDRLTSKSWYYALWFEENWITDSHIDVILYYLRVKAREYGFEQSFTTADSYFMALLKRHHDLILKNETSMEECLRNKSVTSAIQGRNVECGKRWAQCDHVYMPLNIGKHWILLVFDVGEKRIRIYDSLNCSGQPCRRVKEFLPCIEMHLGRLMDCMGVYTERGEEPIGEGKLEIQFVRECPQQTDGHSCGLFVLKIAEYLISGRPATEVNASETWHYRKKMVIDLFQYFGLVQLYGVD